MPILNLIFLSLIISSCSWLPSFEDEPRNESTDESRDEPSQPQETSTYQAPEPIVVQQAESEARTPVKIEPPEPEVEYSYFGVPTAEVEYEEPARNIAEKIDALCREIGNKLGSVSLQDCLDQEFTANGGLSVLGRPIAMYEYPELESREPLGRVLLIGGIHGDEFSAVSIVFKWMEILNEHHSGIFHWRFIPVSNPDGLLAEKSTRQNINGVDLNRNFPSADWNELAIRYWQDRTESNSRRYPGTAAGSEPETIWLVDQIREFKPDVIISVHAPYHLVDYDGPPEAPQRLGDLQLKKLGVFPGSLGNYAGLDLDMPVVTIELPYAGILPSPEQISKMWTDLVAWLVEEKSSQPDSESETSPE